MVFHGTKRKYKRMLYIGTPLAFILLTIGLQGDDFTMMNLVLFVLGGAIAGGSIGTPIVYMLSGEKRVVLTDDELRVEEGKRPKVTKYTDIKKIKLDRKQIRVKLNKGTILINSIHDYPIKEIYKHLHKNWEARNKHVSST